MLLLPRVDGAGSILQAIPYIILLVSNVTAKLLVYVLKNK